MKHDLPSWPRIAVAAAVVVVLGAGVTGAAVVVGAADGPDGGGDDAGTTIGAHGISLVSYDTCDTALAELKNRVSPHVGPYGLDLGSGGVSTDATPAEGGALPAAPADEKAAADSAGRGDSSDSTAAPSGERDHSSTNTHEAGVDEPDLVKTDGKRVASIADGVLRVVDVASREQTATVTLPGGYATQLLLSGDRALVMTSTSMVMEDDVARGDTGKIAPDRSPPVKPMPSEYGSQLVLVDLTGAGTVLGTLSVDGGYLDARQVGAVARVVVRSEPRLGFAYPDDRKSPAAALRDNRSVVAKSTIADWLPRYELTAGGRTTSGRLTDCASVSHPTDYTAAAMLTVLTVDLQGALGIGDPVTIVADGNTVYGTGTSLYVADDHVAHGQMESPTTEGSRTEVYQFDIAKPGKPVYVASGGVDGSLLNQYSLSEHDGNLRVATTGYDQSSSQSMITVLARKGDQLTQLGKVAGLGVGERIYAVRFFGDTGYVVTFRETDPLYTVDLSNPAAPKVTGELKITGYSAYLHSAGDGRLIGVGQEATTDGRRTGAQVSLFDTANPAAARRVAQYHLAGAWTEVEGDPHAFLYWPEKNLVVLPVSGGGTDRSEPTAGALVLKLNGDSFTEVGMLSHTSDRYGDMAVPPRRALVIGDELWTVSEAGMLVNNVDSLAQLAWLPFS